MKKATPELIEEFLGLPVEALPSVVCTEECDRIDVTNAWDAILNPGEWIGGDVMIRADRDGWREGFIVEVKQ